MNHEYSGDYCTHFADVAESHFHTRMYPSYTIEDWHLLVESLEEGYDDVPPEFDYDIMFRETIEMFIVEKSIMLLPEHFHFIQCIQQIDSKFLEVTQPDPRHNTMETKLWESRLPVRATKTYIDFPGKDLLKKWGLTIILIE